ncbi:MAG: hypothetical protein KBT27_06460 [Prevotellaceae bacterium]|nr:hypothetical protein [Candidatus Faecinaster equi]
MAKKNFSSLDSLKNVEKVINEASIAINDPTRTINTSSIPDVLGGVVGAAFGGAIGFAGLYGLGVSGLSAAGLTSALATAGGLIGGGMAAGVAVLASPAVILGVIGYSIARRKHENKINEERKRLYNLALQKHQAIINMLKESARLSKERADYLQALNILLQRAINDLKEDLGIK